MNSIAEYRERTYRTNIKSRNLVSYHVAVLETDLFISSDTNQSQKAIKSILKCRHSVETYIDSHKHFLTSLVPLAEDELAPPIIREMLYAARISNVGPMASVAGAIAQFVGNDLLSCQQNVIVENGGDIFIRTVDKIRVGIFAGTSPFSNKLSILIKKEEMPLGICTSSFTVGPSLSLGRADAVCIKSPSAALADAAATAICNRVKDRDDINAALSYGMSIQGVTGVVIIIGDRMGAIGEIEFSAS